MNKRAKTTSGKNKEKISSEKGDELQARRRKRWRNGGGHSSSEAK